MTPGMNAGATEIEDNTRSDMSIEIRSVLISDAVDPLCAKILEESGITVVQKQKLSQNELISELKHHDGLIVRSETKVTAEVLSASSHLKLVGRAGTGVDNIDCQAATRHGVLVMNTPGGNTLSAAEHTCAMIAAMARHIPQGCATLKNGQWNRKHFVGCELNGKTLAILGLGRIGKEVATRMQAFGMKTIGYDPITPYEVAKEFGVEKMELEDIWPQADFITVHTPLMPQTRNLLNKITFAKCKKGVKVVNVARGGIIDEAALFFALEQGQCGGAALDVFAEEPPRSQWYFDKLFAHPNVICTPHLGASTHEAQLRVAQDIAEQFVQLVKGKSMIGVVNAPNLNLALSPSHRPWIQLAQSLGFVSTGLSDLNNTTSRKIQVAVTTFGKELQNSPFLTAAVLVGQMSGMTENGVNMVNAPTLAQEAGFQVNYEHGSTLPAGLPSTSALLVEVKIEKTVYTILGAVVGNIPTLFAINGATIEGGMTLSGNLIFFIGEDKPNGLALIFGALASQNAIVTTLLRSSPIVGNKVWYAARTSDVLNDPANIKIEGMQFITQRTF